MVLFYCSDPNVVLSDRLDPNVVLFDCVDGNVVLFDCLEANLMKGDQMQGYKMQGDPTLIWMHKPSKYLALETSELRELSYYIGPEKITSGYKVVLKR